MLLRFFFASVRSNKVNKGKFNQLYTYRSQPRLSFQEHSQISLKRESCRILNLTHLPLAQLHEKLLFSKHTKPFVFVDSNMEVLFEYFNHFSFAYSLFVSLNFFHGLLLPVKESCLGAPSEPCGRSKGGVFMHYVHVAVRESRAPSHG